MTNAVPNQPNYAAQIIQVQALLDALAKEKASGYKDTSVAGGLDPFVKTWSMHAHNAVHHPMFRGLLRRHELIAPKYATKSPAEREAWIDKIIRWCDGIIAGSTPVPLDQP